MNKDFVPMAASVHALSDTVLPVMDEITAALPRLAALVTPQGSIRTGPLREVLEPVVRPFGLTPGGNAAFAGGQIDFTGTDLRIALSLQAGRAYVNNGALVSVLAAASDPSVDWAVVIVPELYKGSSVYPKVLDQLREIQAARGIHLELQGVALVSY